MNTVVVDLDGTLANVEHRLHLVKREKPDFDAFYAAVAGDGVNEWCARLMASMSVAGYDVVIVSARRQECEAATRKWLERNAIPFTDLRLLRPDGDSTPDQELKRAWLRAYGKENVLFVVDDRQKVVDMWREEGVTCLQCAAWPEYKKARTALPTPKED